MYILRRFEALSKNRESLSSKLHQIHGGRKQAYLRKEDLKREIKEQDYK